MKTVAAILALAGSAVAFAPSQQGSRASSALAEKPFEDALGAMAPLGLFDPLGLVADGNQELFDALRERELKHGRVCMLAVVGYLTTAAGIRFPGAEDIPDGLKAFPALMETSSGMNVLYQMGAFFAVAEIVNRDATWLDKEPAEFIGDYRNGALDFGWDTFSEEEKFSKRTIELNNGRAAMMGIWGLVVHEMIGVSILPGGYLPGQ
eukprot:CAMPEP_0168741736 /NCGR_PEP_ID=MMETSP0724-20121128/12675_1 /TAXON_ID=265536 /ORGANISM="Amphiprora sp., Strain CCMP467" /LENGTH=206 /DNA_ID=CAMNT_0008789265 /DNA_START=38 /DNA_END=658 /DNA_ORIENTATION=+